MDKTNESRVPAVSIQDLKMSYGDKQVLSGINLEIQRGQIIGYIGPNGEEKVRP